MILITGGAGFIGSNFILQWIAEEKSGVINLDKLSGAGNLNNLSQLEYNQAYHFIKGDIRNRSLMHEILRKYQPHAIIHCAAETYGGRSAQLPEQFLLKNISGTADLLEEALSYWKELDADKQQRFRLLHVSSHQVYGQSNQQAQAATEKTPFAPVRPYAASKASADHLVESYYRDHGLPTLITHSSNNYGPYQFPQKLVPFIIVNALQGKPLHVNSEACNTLPWSYVGDHCAAIRLVLSRGKPGETYNIPAQTVVTNRELIMTICHIMDELKPDSPFKPHASLITTVKEHARQGQSLILDGNKTTLLGWEPKETFEFSLRKTIQWYLQNMPWVENVVSGDYKDWIHASRP